ncbi:MAG: TRAM domain-containing protein [Desulfurococcales archaeon]|nr:TRAM domain-containing protein [Desulfurococcales archaeon]
MRARKRKRSDVYRTDMNRLSVYPSFRKPKENMGRRHMRIGDIVKIRITGVDDDGNPIGVYQGYTVVITDSQFEPGQEVTARITEVHGRTLYAEKVEQN